MSNNIPVVKSYRNKSGDLLVVCESKDTREQIKNLVLDKNENIVFNTPEEKRPSITIVGLPKEYKKEEIVDMLTMQNGYIKTFAVSNKIEEHITIHAIRPLKNNSHRHQVFATVSPVLRQGLKYFNDKVTLGLTTCKVYDRFHVKRCNNCQNFGHYAKDCPNPTTCGKCSGDHPTTECIQFTSKCINCTRNKEVDIDHAATSFHCPSFLKQQNDLKSKLNRDNLNLPRSKALPHR